MRDSMSIAFQYKALSALSVLTATMSVLQAVYYIGHLQGREYARGPLVDRDFMLLQLRTMISVALVIAAGGLLIHQLIGRLISTVSFLFVCVVYLWWYFEKFNFLNDADIRSNPKIYEDYRRAMGLFNGSTNLDLIILGLVIILFAWALIALVRMRQHPLPSSVA